MAEERIAGISTFIARSLVVRGIAVPAPPNMVDFAIRREHHMGFARLIDRLRRPVPRLLLRPSVAPLTLFEYWTHHDDLVGGDAGSHPVPPTLVEVLAPPLRYQLKKLPDGVRITIGTDDGRLVSSVGPESGPSVVVEGTPANLVRWLAGRAAPDLDMSGHHATVRALRTFNGRV